MYHTPHHLSSTCHTPHHLLLCIVGYEPSVTPGMVHHTLLYGCAEPYSDRTAWDCKNMGGTCKAESGKILYAWANNAEGLQLPEGVGYRVGQDAGIRHLVVQLHFGNPNRSSDTSGLTVSLTKTRYCSVC